MYTETLTDRLEIHWFGGQDAGQVWNQDNTLGQVYPSTGTATEAKIKAWCYDRGVKPAGRGNNPCRAMSGA